MLTAITPKDFDVLGNFYGLKKTVHWSVNGNPEQRYSSSSSPVELLKIQNAEIVVTGLSTRLARRPEDTACIIYQIYVYVYSFMHFVKHLSRVLSFKYPALNWFSLFAGKWPANIDYGMHI